MSLADHRPTTLFRM